MDQNHSDKPEGAPAGAQNADADAPSGGAGPERRNSARRKLAAVTRLLRGEPLETLARELTRIHPASTAWQVPREDWDRPAGLSPSMRSLVGSADSGCPPLPAAQCGGANEVCCGGRSAFPPRLARHDRAEGLT